MIYTIYKIVCEDLPNFNYVGSTQAFRQRKAQHKSDCNNEKAKQYNFKLYKTIRENGGWDNWRMVCIDEIEVDSNRKAEAKEEEWRMKLEANLNERRCYVSEEQKKEHNRECGKEYRENNEDKIREYRENNKDKIKEQVKEWYENNKDKVKEQMKDYQETNKEQIKEWKNTKCVCECGGKYTNANKSIHIKSKKHQKYLNEN